jgi:RNA polymerase sigma-70 factor (ECF subfamily)
MSTTTTILKFGRVLTQEFEKIFRDHSRFIYRTAYSVTGNHADAEDVLQTIFVKLLQKEMTPRFWNEPRAYLYRAALNLALNIVRTRKRRQASNDVETLEAVAAIDMSHLESIQQDLMDSIAQLNPPMVQMLILRYGHNYSDAEIAKMLGKSRGTVAVTLYRARTRLKRLMRDGETK